MRVLIPGKQYALTTAKGGEVVITFCHTTADGFVDGITTEELIDMLIHRQKGFVDRVDTTENLNVLTFLTQIQIWLKHRLDNKRKRKSILKKQVTSDS